MLVYMWFIVYKYLFLWYYKIGSQISDERNNKRRIDNGYLDVTARLLLCRITLPDS